VCEGLGGLIVWGGLCISVVSYLLLHSICFMMSSFILSLSLKLYASRRFVRKLVANALCSGGWHECLGMMVSVGFL
jgi:hypothetical protein